ncbi:glycosyltransferase family 2 protein [Kushneria phosphatilytica]|uniref:Glycosyltransferase family 2 protein n=1 Tax=Kushneria phosphatilytica TaxID=657387 RepID=A0A5C1A0H8_9GAMM|nr:hypothetical protein [Kushneria phosphatilytica]QEL11183.1 hypothetical protein FY550_08570 [Kushneria phosphatilytica]
MNIKRKSERFFRKVNAFLLYHYYNIINIVGAGEKLKEKGCDVVVSLTTYPARIDQVHVTLESIFAQKGCNFIVCLYLSEKDIKSMGGLPDKLKRLERRGLRIVSTKNDFRSYNKLVFALREYPDCNIVTADDDAIYPKDWLWRLLEGSRRFPGCIICHRGHMFTPEAMNGKWSYGLMKNKGGREAETPSLSLMPTGNSGVLYFPGSLDEMATDSERFLEMAPSADDIWFKMASLKRGTKCVRINHSNLEFLPTQAAAIEALHDENIKNGANDIQMRRCFETFPELEDQLVREWKSKGWISI